MGIDDGFRRFYASRAQFHRKGQAVDGTPEPGLRADVRELVKSRFEAAEPDEKCRLLTLQALVEISDGVQDLSNWMNILSSDYGEVHGLNQEDELPE